LDGEPLLCVSMPLSRRVIETFAGTEAAALVIAEPAASLGQVLGDLAPRLVFSGLIGVAAALVLGFLLSQSVAAPLRNIARAARNVARGSYSQRVPATGPREVRDLATNFNRMTEEVQSSQQTLRDFLANISHELKTPLTSVRGFSTALVDGTIDSDEERERALRVINSETSRVLRLVEELLALSRLESGQLAMNREPLLLQELFDHVHDVFQLRAENSGVRLGFEEQTTAPVFGDFDRLEQVLSNLLDNALRHTPQGGTVSVVARQTSEATVQVRVSDSGDGIAPQHLPHLFERFYRADQGSGEHRGHGLGLAICREIVRAHGGEIRAESALGRGTTFVFTLRSRGEDRSRRSGRQLPGTRVLRRRSRPEPEA
ncbi:MAG: sensor histidine kinase, partial [Dehalococcoidia bacterium]